MLSRIADSLFWLNRYMERADDILRVSRTSFIIILDKGIHGNITWRPVLEMFTYAGEEVIASLENDTDAVLRKILLDPTNSNSLKVIVNKARENARGVQDHITKEVWEQVNQLYHAMNHLAQHPNQLHQDALAVLDGLTAQTVMYTGVTDITMPRGTGWNFMNIGRFIERCMQTLEMIDREFKRIDYNLADQQDILYWSNLLLSVSGYELHLKTYRTNNVNQNVLHQVIVNTNFTRSIIYALSRIDKYLEEIIKENHSSENEALSRHFGRLYSFVKFVEFDQLDGETLQVFLETVSKSLLEFSQKLGQSFFSYS